MKSLAVSFPIAPDCLDRKAPTPRTKGEVEKEFEESLVGAFWIEMQAEGQFGIFYRDGSVAILSWDEFTEYGLDIRADSWTEAKAALAEWEEL